MRKAKGPQSDLRTLRRLCELNEFKKATHSNNWNGQKVEFGLTIQMYDGTNETVPKQVTTNQGEYESMNSDLSVSRAES